MLLRAIKSVQPGEALVTIADAIRLDSDILSDSKENKSTAVAEVKQYIEGRKIKAYATDDRGDVYYSAVDLKVPNEKLI